MSSISQVRVGVDWGSSSFRAYRFNDSGCVIDRIQTDEGLKHLTPEQFESTLFTHIESWIKQNESVLLCGMITSRSGWIETPYLNCPTKPAADRSQLTALVVRDTELLFTPGLCQYEPTCDVMRGEELQLLGVHNLQQTSANTNTLNSVIILPGTHSKWAVTQAATISGFTTIPTGEMFDAIVHRTLLGEFANANSWDDAAFQQGVEAGFGCQTIMNHLFSVRANVLLKKMEQDEVYAYLSGLMIGCEIKEGNTFCAKMLSQTVAEVYLVGSKKLCKIYQRALQILDIQVVAEYSDATEAGFVQVAQNLNN